MKKRIISLLLTVIMVATLFTACSPSDPSNTSGNNAGGTTGPNGELPTINILWTHGYAYEDFENNVIWQEVAKQIGANVHIIGADTDKYNAMLASGEGWDLVIQMSSEMKGLTETGAILPLDSHMGKLTNLSTNIGAALENSKAKYSADGKLYWIPYGICPNGQKPGDKDLSRGLIRWDLYKDMGYPEVKNMADQAQLLIDMVAKYPKNADGQTVYAYALPNDAALWNNLKMPFMDNAGRGDWSTTAMYKWEDMSYINFLDAEDGVYWDAIDYYHTLYKAGVLDPDSFTVTEADINAKITAGRLYGACFSWNVSGLPEGQGFAAIPMTEVSTACFEYIPKAVDGGNFNWGYAINAQTDKVDLCLKYLDFIGSYEGANLLVNGIEGTHYVVEDGVRKQTQAAIDLKAQGDEAWEKYGMFTGEVGNLMVFDSNAIMSDGLPLNLANNPANWTTTLTAIQQDFCEHYGVSYPGEAFVKAMKDNNLVQPTKPTAEQKASLTPATDEIKVLEDALKLEAETWAARLIMASDAEYESLIADAKAAFEAAGLSQVDAYFEGLS